MKERRAKRLAVGLYGLMFALTACGAVLHIITRRVEVTLPFAFRGSDIAMILVIGSVGILIATRRTTNPIGWMLLATSVIGSVVYAAAGYVIVSFERGGTLPATDPIVWGQNWLWVPMLALLLYSVSVFPDGRALSVGWKRFLTWFVPVAFIAFAVSIATVPGQLQGFQPGRTNPYALSKKTSDAFAGIGGFLFIVTLIATVVTTVKRFRRSSGIAREQMKWLVLSGWTAVAAFAGGFPVFLTSANRSHTTIQIAGMAMLIAILSIPVAMGIAILRYRLYDVNVVINKAVLYAALAAGISIVYVAVIVGIGTAVGARGKPNVGLSVAATALVAVAFQPLRTWAQRLANRLVYGKRATPHEVLSVLGEQIGAAYSLDDVLPRLAQLVTEATAASSAEIWVKLGGELHSSAAWPEPRSARATVPALGDLPNIPGAQHVFPVRHRGELLGAVAASAPTNEPLSAADDRLLTDLASHAGLVLRNVGLIEELRASRQRLVSAQDAERRKLERNLHDGAQQQLVALSIKLRLARTALDSDAAQTAQLLEQLQSDAAEAVQTLRDLAHGIYPPVLADQGLTAALTTQAAKAPIPTNVVANSIGRYPMEIEAAVYFCVLEALQNVSKYSRASQAIVRLAEDDGRLAFTVTDDGVGFDATSVARGMGLTNMADRIEALGGRLDIESHPGAGTTVRGSVPGAG